MQIYQKPLLKTASRNNRWQGKLTLKNMKKEIQISRSRDRPRPRLLKSSIHKLPAFGFAEANQMTGDQISWHEGL